MDLSVVLTSAAVSAVVSSLFLFVSQWLERRARQREFLLKTAADWATKQQDVGLALTRSGTTVSILPLPMLAYGYYRQLASLMKRGQLTPEEQKRYEELVLRWTEEERESHGAGD
jgi:hypothetical protein